MSAFITVANTGAAGANRNSKKNIIIKDGTPFTNCLIEVNNTQIDNAKE